MPIYEYACLDCRKRVNVFFRAFSQAKDEDALCPLCHGSRLQRLVSRVTVTKTDDSRMDDLADSSLMAGLENEDPQALAHFMRRMSDETGEPIDAEMGEVIGRLEAGESVDSIEDTLPDLGDEMGPGGGDMGLPSI